ncbi:MAG: DUF2975 domain-containing protein [Stappiaceae bacterium]
MPTDSLVRITTMSQWLKHLTTVGIFIFVGFALSVLLVPEWFDTMVTIAYQGIAYPSELTLFKRLGLILLLAGPFGSALYGLWNLRALFDCYGQGNILGRAPSRFIRAVGFAMVLNAVLTVLTFSLGSLLLTFDNPAGQKQLAVSVSSDLFFVFLMGGLLLVIGHVLHEASRISDENRQIV